MDPITLCRGDQCRTATSPTQRVQLEHEGYVFVPEPAVAAPVVQPESPAAVAEFVSPDDDL